MHYEQKKVIKSNSVNGNYDFSFYLLYFLWVLLFLRPERILGLIYLYSLTTIIQMALLGLWLFTNRKVLYNQETKYFVLFIILMFVSGLFARQSGYARIICMAMLLILATYLTTISFADGFSKVEKLVNIFVLGNIVMAILGLKIGQVLSIPTLCDENDYSLLLNITFPFAFFLAQESKSRGKRIFYWIGACLLLAGVVVSSSRGGFVGLIAVLLYCLYKTTPKSRIFLYILILGLLAAFLVPNSYWNEIGTIKQEFRGEGSEATGRLFYAKVAWRMFLDHPIIGIGPENYGIHFPEYIMPGDDEEHVNNPHYYYGLTAHSIYSTLLSELGLAGVLLFIALLTSISVSTRSVIKLGKNKQQMLSKLDLNKYEKWVLSDKIRKGYFLSLAITGGYIAYLASGAFLSVLYYQWWWILLTMNVALNNALLRIIGDDSV